jgi:hypothetical protein
MNPQALATPRWLTAAFDRTPQTTPMELRALGEHLRVCRHHRGRWFQLRCGAEAINGFMATRCVTTLAAAALLGTLVWLIA